MVSPVSGLSDPVPLLQFSAAFRSSLKDALHAALTGALCQHPVGTLTLFVSLCDRLPVTTFKTGSLLHTVQSSKRLARMVHRSEVVKMMGCKD